MHVNELGTAKSINQIKSIYDKTFQGYKYIHCIFNSLVLSWIFTELIQPCFPYKHKDLKNTAKKSILMQIDTDLWAKPKTDGNKPLVSASML